MKARSILGYTLLMLIFSTMAVEAVAHALMGRSVLPTTSSFFKEKPHQTVDSSFRCSDKTPLAAVDQSSDPHIQRLAKYQELCGSAVAERMMIFTDMPKDNAGAAEKARVMASTLKEFSARGVKPLVIAEPVTEWGDIDFTEFGTGLYDPWLDTYFKTLKAEGLTAQQMGVWVPFPEANLPYWNRSNAKPEDFGLIVNKYLTVAKQHFPSLEASILLNSATYEADDFDWARGEYVSLVPYVKAIKPGLVQSFGLQGFPWMPPANKTGSGIFDAAEFLNYKLAKEAADALGVKKIWFNTGTFSAKYVGDPQRETYVDPQRRTDVLNGVIAQAKTLQTQGYDMSVSLFAEDKGETAEGTNWAYFGTDPRSSVASPVFANFAARLQQNDIELWLFDRQ